MIMVEVTKIWWDGERLMAEPVDSAIMYKDNEVAQPDSTCNNTLRAEGKGYPRTCRKCGKGPCVGEPVKQCRTDGRCQYAIDSGAEGMGHCPKGKCVMPAHRKPLTDEEIEREWQFLHDEEGNPPDHHDFARAIEAAHGIKENT